MSSDSLDPGRPAAGPVVDDEPNPIWGPDWPEVRDLWPLERTVAHLNHGSYGAVPKPVLDEQQSWRDRMESNPVRFFTRELDGALEQAGAEVAGFLGARPEAVVFVPNVTAATSTVLAALRLTSSDAVLLTDHAYGAVRIAAERFAADAGARVDTVHLPLDASDEDVTDLVMAAVQADTRLAVVEHVTSSTARRLPLIPLVGRLQERDVAVLVDAAHAPGMLTLEVDRLGADYWVGALHKWALAPRGTAVLAVHERAQHGVRPLVSSWREAAGFPHAFSDVGTEDVTAWLSAPRALRVLERLGLDRVRRHNVELAVAGQHAVATGLGHAADQLPRDSAVSMQLVPLPAGVAADHDAAAALQERIGEEVAVEVGVTTWAGRGFVRLSAHVYNCPADFQRLAATLPALL